MTVSAAQIAPGYNNAPGLATIQPQPMEFGLLEMERRYSPFGPAYQVGKPWTMWKYGPQLPPSDYNTIIATIGTLTGSSRLVTVRTLLDDRITYGNFNAIIDIPFRPSEGDWSMAYWNGLVFTLRNLVAI